MSKLGHVLLRLELWPQCSKKSATELKQKLLKCKWTIQIATLNIRTLNKIGQLLELTALAIDHNIDIICIQEHRYTRGEDIKYHDTDNGWMLAIASAWKNSINATIGGEGMLIGPRALKSQHSIEKIQPRMMGATFNGNPSATIISCYSPTNVSEETELITFNDELSSLVWNEPLQASAFISMHTKWNICALIKQATSPH